MVGEKMMPTQHSGWKPGSGSASGDGDVWFALVSDVVSSLLDVVIELLMT
jgi:hypothetical protein